MRIFVKWHAWPPTRETIFLPTSLMHLQKDAFERQYVVTYSLVSNHLSASSAAIAPIPAATDAC